MGYIGCPKCNFNITLDINAPFAGVVCEKCNSNWGVYNYIVRNKQTRSIQRSTKNQVGIKRWSLRVIKLDGGEDFIEFNWYDTEHVEIKSRDHICLVYGKNNSLAAIGNYTIGRIYKAFSPGAMLAQYCALVLVIGLIILLFTMCSTCSS